MVIAAVSNLNDAPGLSDVVFALGELFIPPGQETAVIDSEIAGR